MSQIITISIILWIIFSIFSIIMAIYLSKKFLFTELEGGQRDYFLGMVLFIIIHLIARIFYMLYDFYYIGGVPYELFWDIAAIIGVGSLIFLLFAIERHILKKSRYIFTILSIITFVLLIVLPVYKEIIQLIMIPIVAILVPAIYIYTAAKISGKIRKNSLIIAFSLIIFILGQSAHSTNVWDIFPYAIAEQLYYIVSPIGLLIGGIMLFYGLMKT